MYFERVDPFGPYSLKTEEMGLIFADEKKYNLNDFRGIRIKQGIPVGTRFSSFGSFKKGDKFTIGRLISKQDHIAYFENGENPMQVIKTEVVGKRAPEDFFAEITLQNEIARQGHAVRIDCFEIGEYEREVSG